MIEEEKTTGSDKKMMLPAKKINACRFLPHITTNVAQCHVEVKFCGKSFFL